MPRRLPRGSESELRIQRVAEPVAQQVDAERRERERRAGERGQPPRDVEKVAALREHAAPRGRGRLDAEAEEADRGLRDDEGRELETRDDDDGGRDVRQDVPKEEADTAHPERRGRLHEIALLDGQHLAPHDASIHDPPRGRKAEDDVAEPEPDDRVDRHGEQDEREESWTSAMRMSTAEGQRSTNPATRPRSPPATVVMSTVQTPMKSASRAPWSTRARRSRPS